MLLGLAAALALFAADVRAWQGAITQSDARFRAQRAHIGLWRSPAVLPADPARSVLGIDDALSYRRAVQLFWLSQIGSSTGGQADLAATRVEAQADLQALMTCAPTARGTLERGEPARGHDRHRPVQQPDAEGGDRDRQGLLPQAVIEDPTNYNAKINLELLLRVARPGSRSSTRTPVAASASAAPTA